MSGRQRGYTKGKRKKKKKKQKDVMACTSRKMQSSVLVAFRSAEIGLWF